MRVTLLPLVRWAVPSRGLTWVIGCLWWSGRVDGWFTSPFVQPAVAPASVVDLNCGVGLVDDNLQATRVLYPNSLLCMFYGHSRYFTRILLCE